MTSVADSDETRRADDRLGRAVADMLERRAGGLDPEIRAAIVDNLTGQTTGNTCTETPAPAVPGLIARLDDVADPHAARRATAAVPFVSAGRYLYTQRQFLDELSLADRVQRLVDNDVDLSAHVPPERLEALLPPLRRKGEPPYAVPLQIGREVLRSNFNLLIGGPGTGKTYSLTRYLALLVEALLTSTGSARIAVCAPTGKAAARAGEMLAQFCTDERAALAPEVAEVLGGVAPTTIHTLLRPRRDAPGRFRHDAVNQLDIDVLVVDEMSMVALPLMARLLEAVPDGCRVLLVGDEAQLESIDVGAVLAELSRSRSLGELGRVGRLTHVFRRDTGSSINDAAYAIRDGAVEKLIEVLDQPDDDLEWVKVTPTQLTDNPTVQRVAKLLDPVVEKARSESADLHAEALAAVTGVKVLCGPRHGPTGVNAWNRAIAQQLGLRVGAPLPPGTPVLVTVNAPLQHLVNGSVGLVVRTPNGVRVAFAPSSDDGPIRYFTFAELPPNEVCFAMTVHKSQGSEYDGLVVTVLPHEDSPLLTRELLYTALTRAKRHAVLVGTRESISTALARPTTRTSGLAWIVDQLAGRR